MAANKRIIATTIHLHLTQSELNNAEKVRERLGVKTYAKAFREGISESQYLLVENERLEKLIDKLLSENNIEKQNWLASLSGQERQQANALTIGEEETE